MRKPVTAGQPFGRGRVLDPDVGRDRHQLVLVLLRCDPDLGGCGATYETTGTELRRGKSQSCGCLQRDWTRSGDAKRAHGLGGHPLYKTWQDLIARCESPRSRSYPDYGGRVPPVTVWGPWHDPARFITDVLAEIGPRPPGRTRGGRPLYTLDRRDNNLGYRPGNIRWATWAQQRRNQRPRRRGATP